MIAIALALQIAVTAGAPGDGAMSAMSAMGADTLPIIAPEQDAWFGPDKFKHAGMSYAITAYAFGATRSEPAAIASAAAAGIVKELYDRRRGSLFSVRDLIWDAAGIALGYVVVKQAR